MTYTSRPWRCAILIQAQIRLPDALYREAKRVAADDQMSFAEVVRRSLERTLPAYPPKAADRQSPEPLSLGLRCPIGDDEWRLLAKESDYLGYHGCWFLD